jgi:hypothetical protein
MNHGRPYKYILGAVSAVLLSLPGVAGAYVPASDAIYNANMAATVSKISNNYFDNVKQEVSAFIAGAKTVDANAALDNGQKEQAIVTGAKNLVQKYPEAVPSLLAETKVGLTAYYEAVKVAVTQVEVGLTKPSHAIDEASATEQISGNGGNAITAAADSAAKPAKKAWLSYKMETKDKYGRKLFVTWSPTEWKGAGWWSPAQTKTSQKAWKVAVFNNKYLTMTPLSSTQQVATLWGPWANNADMMNEWANRGWITKKSTDVMAGTIAKFIGNNHDWLEKFGGSQMANVNVVRVNPVVINAVIDTVITNNTSHVDQDLDHSHEKPTPPPLD